MKRITIAVALITLGLGGSLAGCSLLSFESPAKPLSERDLNTRVATREYARMFVAKVERAADAAAQANPELESDALRWKIGASEASRYAATFVDPTIALLDTWALSAQMQVYFDTGAGSQQFGDQLASIRAVAAQLHSDARKLATLMIEPKLLPGYEDFVKRYVQENPLLDLSFRRTSLAGAWLEDPTHNRKLIATVGTAPEAMNDLADRTRMYSEQVPAELRWQTQLVLKQSNYSTADLRTSFEKLDQRLAELGEIAQHSPEQLNEAINSMRDMVHDTANRFDVSWQALLAQFDIQRVALAQDIGKERAELTTAVDRQRAALMADAHRIVIDSTETLGRQIRQAVAEVVLLGLLAVVVLLGLPFGAGYLLGRARRNSNSINPGP